MQPNKARGIVLGSRRIHGWFSPEAAMLFAWIDEIQKLNGIVGDVFEIGCHHGKSTVLIGAMVSARKERICVCDLFGDQGANVSGSGQGDLEIFRRNMGPMLETGVEMRVHQKNSNALSVGEIGGSFRFFHIDGGHSSAEALSDLRLAARSVIDSGVIALDDAFNSEWPGVTEALIRFLDEFHQFSAIIVGFNKALITRTSSASLYLKEMQRTEMLDSFGLGFPWRIRLLTFCANPLRVLYMPSELAARKMTLFARKYYETHKCLRSRPLTPLVWVTKAILRRCKV